MYFRRRVDGVAHDDVWPPESLVCCLDERDDVVVVGQVGLDVRTTGADVLDPTVEFVHVGPGPLCDDDVSSAACQFGRDSNTGSPGAARHDSRLAG